MDLKKLFDRKTRPAARPKPEVQNWVLSYPKSGRTWLRVLVGRVLTSHYALSSDLMLKEADLTRAAGLPLTDFSHDETSNSEGRPLSELSINKERYRDRNVLLLVRDPRDVVVSCFFQSTRRKSRYSGDLHDFIRSETHGISKIIRFYQIWDQNRDLPASFTLIRYEDLHYDAVSSLTAVLNFMGAKDVPTSIVEEAIEFSSFDRMKEMERMDTLNNKKLRATKDGDPESYKVRRGKIGGFVDYLNPDDIAYCDAMVSEMACPFGYSVDRDGYRNGASRVEGGLTDGNSS